MILSKLFKSGTSFQGFLNKDKDINRQRTLETYDNIVLEEDIIEKIKGIDVQVFILVFAEIWCPDCMINVPALQKMRDINPNIQISILSREDNESYIEAYKFGDKIKIPTFIIFDADYNEKGVFVEYPQTVKDIVAKGNELEITVARRKYKKGEYIADTILEILDIIHR